MRITYYSKRLGASDPDKLSHAEQHQLFTQYTEHSHLYTPNVVGAKYSGWLEESTLIASVDELHLLEEELEALDLFYVSEVGPKLLMITDEPFMGIHPIRMEAQDILKYSTQKDRSSSKFFQYYKITNHK